MLQAPITFRFNFECTDERTRPYVMHEFAANGAKHLVLSETLLRIILGDRTKAETLNREMAAEGLSFCDAHMVDWKHIVGLLKRAPRLQAVQSEVSQIDSQDSIRDICEKFRWLNEL